MSSRPHCGPRAVALVGPYLSGKTSLLESILAITGATARRGTVDAGDSVGDHAPEARARHMGVELNVATTEYMGETFTFLDCPGSVEFLQDSRNALLGADAAIVVCEPDADKVMAIQPILHHLDQAGIPRYLFVNKLDKPVSTVPELLTALQGVSTRPVVLRQVPIFEGEEVTGYVDLPSERAYRYRPRDASELIDVSADLEERRREARYEMLEMLADFDDHLMEELLDDVDPPRDEVYKDLTEDARSGQIVPMLLGCAVTDNGVRRLLKMLRHEAPEVTALAERRGLDPACRESIAQVLKTYHSGHGGKLSAVRVLSGTIKDGGSLNGERVSGVYRLLGHDQTKLAEAGAGEVVALGRLNEAQTGDTLTEGKSTLSLPKAEVVPPVYAVAVEAKDRSDEVKLTTAIARLAEEDPSLSAQQNADTHQMLLWGQGDIHLQVAVARLKNQFGLTIDALPPKVPYKETIRKPVQQRGRHKRQTGGHGQFGDVVLDIKPLPRGSGFSFDEKITGGVVPRQFIPSVEKGVIDGLETGPLGFPVVDIAVTLVDGSYHSVDSSDQAFRTAGRIGITEALPQCSPVLLEPILKVQFYVPSALTSRVNGLVSSRRGQVLGFDAREGWPGWDVVETHLPQAEMFDIIVELRSLTQGAGTFVWRHDHMAELTGKQADQVLASAAE